MTRFPLLLLLALAGCDGDGADLAGDGGPDAEREDARRVGPGDDAATADAGRLFDGALLDGGVADGDLGPPEPVIATLEAPAQVGVCEVLVLDASLSTGRRLRFAWTVEAPEHSEALVARVADEVGPVLVIVPELLLPGATYVFSVTVSDRAQRADTVRVEVGHAPLAPPEVAIDEGERVETARGRPLVLHGGARAIDCDGRQREVGFAWSTEPPLPDVAEVRGPVLDLAPGVLEVGVTYSVTLTAWLADAPDTLGTATIEVAALPGALQPVIAGGDREHPIDRDLQLDASGSRDPDAPIDEPLRAVDGYEFEWGCTRDEGACDLDLAAEPVLSVPAHALQLGGYVFTLTLAQAERSAEVDARVKVVEAPCRVAGPPVVAVARPPEPRVDPRRDLRLHAAVAPRGEGEPQLEWRETTGQLDLADPAVAPAGNDAPVLLVSSGALPPGAALRFRLDATDCAGVGADEVAISVNAPPANGVCRARPDREDDDLVAITCEGWADVDVPLSYTFAAVIDGRRTPLGPPSPEPVMRFEPREDVDEVVVTIRDALGLSVEIRVPL